MNKRRSVYPYIALLLAATLMLASCGGEVYRYSRPVMGTVANVTVVAPDRDVALQAAEAAFAEMARIEKLMSPRLEGSDVSRINRGAAAGPVQVSRETCRVLEAAAALAEETGGAFDVTFVPLGRIWDYRRKPFAPPSDALVVRTKMLVDYRKIVLEPRNRTVRFLRDGMEIGLGALAKGYAVGRAVAALRALGIRDCIVEIGGDLQVSGTRLGRPWITGLRHPRNGGILLSIEMQPGMSVVTSGDYERAAVSRGRRYHHIIDPRTGRPTETFESVSVIAGDPMRADAVATALFVLGEGEGMQFLARHRELQVILVDLQGGVRISRSLRDRVTLFENIPVRWI
ncbi:MAG: FAD:protein FMN transferase [Spirochaetes bacterium]|nr:FAD:protein FMN transferase [Spirochaetota bacterium]